MGDFPRKADGRRIFTAEFKRGVVQQIVKGEKTLAEVSRELDIQPTVIRQWKRRVESGAATAVAADEDVVPASLLRAAQGGSRSSSAAWGASRWRSRSCRRPRRS
jgi:transposase